MRFGKSSTKIVNLGNHGTNLSFHRRRSGRSLSKVSGSLNSTRRIGILFLIDLATEYHRFTLPSTSKPRCSCLREFLSVAIELQRIWFRPFSDLHTSTCNLDVVQADDSRILNIYNLMTHVLQPDDLCFSTRAVVNRETASSRGFVNLAGSRFSVLKNRKSGSTTS